MKKNVELLYILNLLVYVLAITAFFAFANGRDIGGTAWFVFFAMIITLLLSARYIDYNFNYKYEVFMVESRIDLAIRILGVFLIYLYFSGALSLSIRPLLIIAVVLLFLSNIVLEYMMNKKYVKQKVLDLKPMNLSMLKKEDSALHSYVEKSHHKQYLLVLLGISLIATITIDFSFSYQLFINMIQLGFGAWFLKKAFDHAVVLSRLGKKEKYLKPLVITFSIGVIGLVAGIVMNYFSADSSSPVVLSFLFFIPFGAHNHKNAVSIARNYRQLYEQDYYLTQKEKAEYEIDRISLS